MKNIQKKIALFVATLAVVAAPLLAGGSVVLAEGTAGADGTASEKMKGGLTAVGGKQSEAKLEDNIKTIVNVMLFLLGAIAVIMIIIGGIRYATSNGDSSQLKGAKDTILYAVVGLVVAILAYAIVNFVVTSFTSK